MTDMPISRELADRLQELAQQESRSIEELLDEIVTSRLAEQPSRRNTGWAKRMAKMIKEDTSGDWNGFPPDLVERSREILNNEFADYLKSRMQDDEG